MRTLCHWIVLGCLVAALAACSREAPPEAVATPPPLPPPAMDEPAVPPGDAIADGEIAQDDSEGDFEGDPEEIPTVAPDELEPAPWSAAKLAADAVPAPFLAQWRKAENRATCAPVAPIDTADRPDAKPRSANFSGGWAVAYDEPGLRSAFGIAGAGIEATGAGDSIWPDSITWADGSTASYGLEGGTGPGHLAYLEIAGQGCLYNVWSKLGEEHLLALLGKLRRVEARR